MQTETNSIIGQLPPHTQPYWSEDQRLRARWALNVVSILGIQTACANVPKILRLVKLWVNQRQKRTIFYVNAHCLNVANSDAAYFTILNQASLVYADGIGIIWANRFLHGAQSEMAKATGADWIEQFCTLAEMQKWRIYILAGKYGVAAEARRKLLQKWPSLQVVGVCDGFFLEKNEAQVLQEIQATAPHVVFVGMGTPRQEKWLTARREQIPAPVCWAVGALFDYVAGIEPRVPYWMNMLALEWFWRLLVDPKGKWRRYLIGNPLFVYRVIRQKWFSKS